MSTGKYWRWDRETGIVSPTNLDWFVREMEYTDRQVCDWNYGGVRVSTVFLSLNHNYSRDGLPLVFETLVFGGPMDGEIMRYGTLSDAKAGHAEMVTRVVAAEKEAAEKADLIRQIKEESLSPNAGKVRILPVAEPVHGIALRDYFAAHALTGLVTSETTDDAFVEDVAESAYNYADAMMARREKKA